MQGEYIAVVTANAMAAGRFVALVEGERLQLSIEEAEDLLRAGYVKPAGSRVASSEAAVETAALEPGRTATAPAQEVKNRKASAR